jgi:hypothetical protein
MRTGVPTCLLCRLQAFAAQRNDLEELKAAFLMVEGVEIDGNSPLVHQAMRLVHDYVTLDLPRQFVPAA